MSLSDLFLDETLPIRRLGSVTHATIISRLGDQPAVPGEAVESSITPITLPTQLPIGGWLRYPSPTTGKLVTENRQMRLFSDSRYYNSIRLHTFNLPNIALLDSIASVFDHPKVNDRREEGIYGYNSIVPSTDPFGRGSSTPHLLYYRPVENPAEQYLLLYNHFLNMYERPGDDESPSFAELYELVQVELDEDRFLYLLRQAMDAAYDIRDQQHALSSSLKARRNGGFGNPVS